MDDWSSSTKIRWCYRYVSNFRFIFVEYYIQWSGPDGPGNELESVCGIAAAKPLWKMGPQKPKISFFAAKPLSRSPPTQWVGR